MLEVVILNDLSNKICVPNKKEDLNLSLFNTITRIDESKSLTKHISCKCKCRFDGRKCNWGQWWNNKCRHEQKKHYLCEKGYVWNLATCNCENGKYLASIVDDSSIMCDEFMESYNKEKHFNKKKATC